MKLLDSLYSLCSRLGIGVDAAHIGSTHTSGRNTYTPVGQPARRDCKTAAEIAALKSALRSMPTPARAPSPEGWLSKIRSWAAAPDCGFFRSKPVRRESVQDALRIARDGAVPGALVGKSGCIKLYGKVTTRRELACLHSLIPQIRKRGGKIDLSELRVGLDLLPPPRPGSPPSTIPLDEVLAQLKTLKTHGARMQQLTAESEIDLDEQHREGVWQLSDLLSLVETRGLCATADRIFEGLTLRATVPQLLKAPFYEAAPLPKLLEDQYGAGARLVLQGSISVEQEQLDALHGISHLPGVDFSNVRVRARLTHRGTCFELTRSEVQKLEDLQRRGVTIDAAIRSKAQAQFGSQVLKMP